MKKLIVSVMMVAIFAACGGASSVDKAISQVEKAIEKVDKNKRNMTESDWETLAKEVEEPLKIIADAMEKDKVGMVAKMKIVAVSAKWAAVIAEAGFNEMGKRMVEAGIEIEKARQELEESGALQELEKAMQELGNENSELAKQLQEAAKALQNMQSE